MSTELQDIRLKRLPIVKLQGSILAILFFGSFVGMYQVVSLNVSLPGFIGIFHTNLQTVQWIVTGFALASGVIVPVSGYASDRFGSKRLFLFALAGITFSSVLCAFAWNIYALIIFRIIQGIFCGLIQPVSLAMLYQTVPPEKQSYAVSIWSFSTILGTAIAPSISGWLLDYDWHWIFLVTVPIGFVVIFMGSRLLPSGAITKRVKLDTIGLILAAAGSLSLLLLFGNMHQWGWDRLQTWICLFIGIGCSTGFVLHELRIETPLLQLRLFRTVTFTISLLISLILSIALYAGIYFIPLYLAEVQGLSSYQTGLLFLPAAFCLMLATFIAGKYYAKFGAGKLIIAGSLVLIVTTYHFSHLSPKTTLLSVIMWLALRNIGTGLALTPATNAAMISIPREMSNHASALINWLRQIFSAMTLGLLTTLFSSRFDHYQAQLLDKKGAVASQSVHLMSYTLSVNNVFLLTSIILILAIPLTFYLLRRERAHMAKGVPNPQ